MSNKTTDFIFCPFCGGVKWTVDKSRKVAEGTLEYHKCQLCKKFVYTNVWNSGTSSAGLEVMNKRRYSVEAIIPPYKIQVFYLDNKTNFIDYDSGDLVLEVNLAVTFNWYKNEELVDKIKKYVVFS